MCMKECNETCYNYRRLSNKYINYFCFTFNSYLYMKYYEYNINIRGCICDEFHREKTNFYAVFKTITSPLKLLQTITDGHNVTTEESHNIYCSCCISCNLRKN